MAFTVADWAFQKELVPLGLVSRASETEGLREMALPSMVHRGAPRVAK